VGAPRNLVLIYLESLEQTYFDDTLFKGLLPSLSKLREEAVSFTRLRQYPGTSWTIAGMVSSQCGVPLLSEIEGNTILREVDNPFNRVTCLAEYLKKTGYNTAFIGGASLDFAGKGNFLRDNGYDIQLGIDELPTPGHSWGMYDEDMLEHAMRLYDGLAQEDAPFLMTILTLDTHHPDGFPSPGCQEYGAPVSMLNAVHCTDQLIGRFVDYIRKSSVAEETVIAIMSDHLLISGEIEATLETRERSPLFFVLIPAHQPEIRDGAASHFDVAPTLLEAVGLTHAQFPFGQSLLSNASGLVIERELTEADFLGFKVETLASGLSDARD
jgi:phosphoglycerol transferase MdoB-like AlkP superfamily enzyme